MTDQIQDWKELAAQLRVDSIRCTTAAASGHPTSSMSAADLLSVLLAKYLKYDWDNPKHPNNDHLIFSKGHACPLLYAAYKAAGAVTDEELLTLRQLGSRLEGHPNPHTLPWVDVATGSLGQGLPIGVGVALDGKYVDKLPFRVWVLLGDSEMAEGSVWEAFDKASYYKLNNLIAIIDVNRLGQRGETDLGWNTAAYAARATAFGWHAIVLDGQSVEEVDAAYAEALTQTDKPTVLIAKTKKGAGVSFLADHDGWHGKALNADQAKEAIAELGGERHITVNVAKPEDLQPAPGITEQPLKLPVYEFGTKEATRKAYGDALVAIGAARADVVVLDGEVSNSTHADEFKKAYPDRFFEMFIAEQQLVSAAAGFGVRKKKAFASTFAAFFTRAYDQVRMGAISNSTIKLVGSHAGVSIGEDGPSQMALEDLASFRAVYGSTVLYPSDANQTGHLVDLLADQPGISYMRTTREKTNIIYGPDEKFTIGGSKVVKQSDSDQVTVVGAGITLHEAVKAHDTLAAEGINIRVIDLYSVKPVDKEGLIAAATATGNKVIVVEDHWPEGGLGDAVLDAFADLGDKSPVVIKMAVRIMPGSGKPFELLNAAGIDAEHIVKAVKELL
ncbi:MAG: transketolase [Capsulimonas sp.]|uniref:transketolase n=1 Tax=Capsulimonas sp. TaxID=2494211 RepID=UPI00326383C4